MMKLSAVGVAGRGEGLGESGVGLAGVAEGTMGGGETAAAWVGVGAGVGATCGEVGVDGEVGSAKATVGGFEGEGG